MGHHVNTEPEPPVCQEPHQQLFGQPFPPLPPTNSTSPAPRSQQLLVRKSMSSESAKEVIVKGTTRSVWFDSRGAPQGCAQRGREGCLQLRTRLAA